MTRDTRRERLEARAHRLEEAATKNRERAEQEREKSSAAVAGIPLGQPVQPGRRGDRHRRDVARSHAAMDRSVAADELAKRQEIAAAEIDRQLERSVYRDDDDAASRLEERISEAEDLRDRAKRFNESCWRAYDANDDPDRLMLGDTNILTEEQREDLMRYATAGQLRDGGAFPKHYMTKLARAIRRDQKRKEEV